MAHDGDVADRFEAERARLTSLAHRMLGSRAEAEDAVQDVWFRLATADVDGIENLPGWLTTVVARVCLDRLRARRSRPEVPVHDGDAAVAPAAVRTPEDEALLGESVGAALLVVLDALRPAERVAFVLHDVFAMPFDEIAALLGQSPDATRQLASRARRRVRDQPATSDVDLPRQRSVVDAFLHAARGGDVDGLVRLLHPEVVLLPDAASTAMGAIRPRAGAAEVAGLLSGGARHARLALIDGVAGFAWAPGGVVRGVAQLTVVDGVVTRIEVVADPAHLAALDLVLLER